MSEAGTRDVISLTLDVDWAPDEILEVVLEKVRGFGLPATVFATHDSPFLRDVGTDFEIALHPSFDGEPASWEHGVNSLKEIYPDAMGARSHRLHVSSPILELYRQADLRYESNLFLMQHPHLRPVWRFSDLLSIPFYWSDDKHIELDLPFSVEALSLGTGGLKVLNFHPIHVFMNTKDEAHYRSFKHAISDPQLVARHRGVGPGVGDLFGDVLEEVRSNGLAVRSLRDVLTEHQGSDPPPRLRSVE